MTSVCSTIHESAEIHGERTALLERYAPSEGEHGYREGREISYVELYARTLRLGTALGREGLGRGDRVAVLLDNSIEMVLSEWCCLLFGYLWVALNTRSSAEEIAAIVADSDPRVLIVASSMVERIERAQLAPSVRIFAVGGAGESSFDRLIGSAPAEGPTVETAADDPVRIRYTSGTAGKPKGAVLARRTYDASVGTVTEVIAPVLSEDVLVQAAPMTHASGAMLVPHVAVGARALLLDRFEARAFVDLMERERGTTVFLVPTMLVRVIERIGDPERARRLSSLKTIVYGGASIPPDRLLAALSLLGEVFVQIYGLTESTWPITALGRDEHLPSGMRLEDPPSERQLARLASCGRPTEVGKLRIVDSDGREVPRGEPGEIHVKGANTMLGYWDRSASGVGCTSEEGDGVLKGLDEDGWMHTGDIARQDADGFVTIVDRLHDMIVTGGFNVYPREVEDVLSTHPAVLESAVVGLSDPEWGQRVHAAVVLRDGKAATPEELGRHCAEHLAGYKKPRTLEIVAALPRNPSGKILRRALRDA